MRLKQRIGDFRVRELLQEGVISERGDYRIYRVTKRKLTTPEAIKALADEVGVETGDVGVAGMKDRQGITVQHMSVPRGRKVRLKTPELLIEAVGFARQPMDSALSRGNAFEVMVRSLEHRDLKRLRFNVPEVRAHGLVNYFDDQRFGNLRHDQGWVARELMRGDPGKALRDLLAPDSKNDNEFYRRHKKELRDNWGNWKACREVAGKFGQHHSVFEHLIKNPEDFAGAFYFVAARLRLIHLYAYQSHVWNRAVCDWSRDVVPSSRRIVLRSSEGPLVTYAGKPPAELGRRSSLRLPGEGLEDVREEDWITRLEDVLARDRLVADQFRIQGISGFQLKGEDRELVVRPSHLRVRPAQDDKLNPGFHCVQVRFELPRGSYATLVVKRLFARLNEQDDDSEAQRTRPPARTRPPRHGGQGDRPRRPYSPKGKKQGWQKKNRSSV